MPLIRSIEKLADGIRITRANGVVLTFTSADVPGTITTVAAAQTFVNTWITQHGWFGTCRVRALSPLDMDFALSDKPMPSGFGF